MKPGPSVMPRWKPPKKRKLRGRARPEEPLGWCEVVVGGIACGQMATERHHKLRRSRGGTDERSNTLEACGYHHRLIHSNPAWAYQAGYLIRGVR